MATQLHGRGFAVRSWQGRSFRPDVRQQLLALSREDGSSGAPAIASWT